jgi:hypothetical protein
MTKFFFATLMALAVTLGPSDAASAQSAPPIQRAIDAALVLQKEMSTALDNLRQMEPGLTTIERGGVHAVFQATIDFQGRLSEVITVGQIHMDMKSVEDRSTVRHYFVESLHAFASYADIDVEYINQNLIYFTTPAVLAEATKIRDAMVRLRDIFQPFAGKPDL